MIWAQVAEFAAKNKWLAYLALVLFIVQGLGGVIVDSIAYFQPRVEIRNITVRTEAVKDKSKKTTETTRLPDGTVRILETMQADIEKLTVDKEDSSTVKEPVPIAGKPSLWAVHGAYAPFQREVSLGVGFQLLPSLVLGLSHPVAKFQTVGIEFAGEFAPQVFATWMLPRLR